MNPSPTDNTGKLWIEALRFPNPRPCSLNRRSETKRLGKLKSSVFQSPGWFTIGTLVNTAKKAKNLLDLLEKQNEAQRHAKLGVST